jgi:hypothetical protein
MKRRRQREYVHQIRKPSVSCAVISRGEFVEEEGCASSHILMEKWKQHLVLRGCSCA